MKQNDAADDTGHADSPRYDSEEPRHPARPEGAPGAPGERHPDGPLPTSGRQPQRPGQDGRHQAHPGDRDDETLKPSDR